MVARKRNTAGFTLVELMLVVTLIGMIAMFAVPNYTKTVRSARERAATDSLLIIYAAQKMRVNNGLVFASGANMAQINTNLRLELLSTGHTYRCTTSGTPVNAFTCTATASDASQTLQITETAATVCCFAGTCKAPAC